MIRIPTVNSCEHCCFCKIIKTYDEKIYKCSKYKIYAETQSDLYKTCQLPDIKSIARVVSYMIGDKGDKND